LNAVGGPPWPTADWISRLIADGEGRVDVDPEVALDDREPDATVDFLRFLRDATTQGLRVNWRARIGTGLSIASIAHLPPPSGGAGLALNPAVSAWRERFRPDAFVWRQGPGFILLMDSRPGAPRRRSRLVDAEVLSLFHDLQTPKKCPGNESRSALKALEDEHAVLELGSLVLALPVRQTRPPIVYRRAMHTFQSAFDAPGRS
jgi:hypothetical protein